MKGNGATGDMHVKVKEWSMGEARGITRGAVKFVFFRQKTAYEV